MIFKTLTLERGGYETPAVEVISLPESTVLCASNDGTTEDFQFEDFTL